MTQKADEQQAEEEQAARDALKVAQSILNGDLSKDVEQEVWMAQILGAMTAMAELPNSSGVDDHLHIIGTALSTDPDDDPHPYSIAGTRFAAFAKAAVMLRARARYEEELTSAADGAFFYFNDEAKPTLNDFGEALARHKKHSDPP